MSKQMNRRFSHGKEKGAARGDDRNLVLVDEDFQDADFEDRVWLYWQRHGRKTIAGAAALFVAIIAAIVWVESGKMRTASLQAEYATAETPEAKLAFARANEGHPIAGTAYFAAGREFSEAGKYAEAADAFGNAGRVFAALEDFPAMRDRAAVSEAAVRARAGTEGAKESAFALLKKLAGTPGADPLCRGQAMYELAAAALAAGNLAEARLWLDEMDRSLDPSNFWQMRKSALISVEPRLAFAEEPVAAPAENAAGTPSADAPAVPAEKS